MSLWYTRSGPTIWCDSCNAIDYSPISSVLPTPASCHKCGYGGLKTASAEDMKVYDAIAENYNASGSTISSDKYDELRNAAEELLDTIHERNLYSAPLPRPFWDALYKLRVALEKSK